MKHYNLAREALSNDCQLVGRYVGDPGSKSTCPIGRLAIMSGVTRKQLRDVNEIAIAWHNKAMLRIRDSIFVKFNLSRHDLSRIQAVNDSWLDTMDENLDKRREAVLSELDAIHFRK